MTEALKARATARRAHGEARTGALRLRPVAGGALGALAWAAQQPLDKRVFASRYDDVELLGKLVTRGNGWPGAGLIVHAANGAAFGAAYSVAARLLPGPPIARGILAGLIEHVTLWPLVRLTDRYHPAREELPRLTGNRRAFAQAAWRHFVFGLVLGAVSAKRRGTSA